MFHFGGGEAVRQRVWPSFLGPRSSDSGPPDSGNDTRDHETRVPGSTGPWVNPSPTFRMHPFPLDLLMGVRVPSHLRAGTV